MSSSSNLESSTILYQTDQPTDLLLWDGNFALISLFGIDTFLNDDTKNIACYLYKIASFIKQRLLGNKTSKNIS